MPQRYTKHFCRHLGKPTGKKATVEVFHRRLSLPLFRCALHRECTLYKSAPGRGCCHHCWDYDPVAVASDAACSDVQ